MSTNHLKNNQSDGKYLDLAFGRLPISSDLCFSNADDTYVYFYNALGEGQWDAIEALFWKGKRLAATEYNFHSGALATGLTTGAQTSDPHFAKDVPHSRTAAVGGRVPRNLADGDTANNPPTSMELIARTKCSGDYNAAGVLTDFGYTLNPARQIVQVLTDYARLPRYAAYASAAAYALSRIDFGAWADFRNFHETTETHDYRTIPDFPGFGLRARYYSGTNFQTLTESFVHPNFDINYSVQPPATVTVQPLSAKFEGYLKFPYSENYTITVTHDDGARLIVNGATLIDQFGDDSGGAIVHTATYAATAGVFTPIEIQWNDSAGLGQLKVEWQSASQAKEVIPSKYLYPIAENKKVYESTVFFTQPTHPLVVIDEILRVTNSCRQEVNGKIRLLALDTLASSFNFDGTNIIEGSFRAAPPNALRRSAVTEYRAKMRNSLTRFVESPVVPPSVFPNRIVSREIEQVQEVELYAMTPWQALKVLRTTDKREQEASAYEFDSFEAKSYPVVENDVITISHRKTGNVPQTFRVTRAVDKSYNRDGVDAPTRSFSAARWTI